jgi:hypothetical protein
MVQRARVSYFNGSLPKVNAPKGICSVKAVCVGPHARFIERGGSVMITPTLFYSAKGCLVQYFEKSDLSIICIILNSKEQY